MVFMNAIYFKLLSLNLQFVVPLGLMDICNLMDMCKSRLLLDKIPFHK